MQERRALSFPPRGGTRAFKLLVDLPNGARLDATTSVALRCEAGVQYGACAGQCVDFYGNPNCGACGVTCRACKSGVCAAL